VAGLGRRASTTRLEPRQAPARLPANHPRRRAITIRALDERRSTTPAPEPLNAQ
jgi:hypothetical protein